MFKTITVNDQKEISTFQASPTPLPKIEESNFNTMQNLFATKIYNNPKQ